MLRVVLCVVMFSILLCIIDSTGSQSNVSSL